MGDLLSDKLSNHKDDLDAFVLAIPNVSAICGYDLAKNLKLPVHIEHINAIFHSDTDATIGHVIPDGELDG